MKVSTIVWSDFVDRCGGFSGAIRLEGIGATTFLKEVVAHGGKGGTCQKAGKSARRERKELLSVHFRYLSIPTRVLFQRRIDVARCAGDGHQPELWIFHDDRRRRTEVIEPES